MIVTPSEVDHFRGELADYEKRIRWLVLFDRERRQGKSPEEMARAVVAQLTPEEIDSTRGFGKGKTHNEFLGYFRQRPHLLVPSGFDELRIEPQHAKEAMRIFEQEAQKRWVDKGLPLDLRNPNTEIPPSLEVALGLRCRMARSGQWYRCAGFDFAEQELLLRGGTNNKSIRLGLRTILANCERAVSSPDHPAVILLPNIWRPPEDFPSLQLAEVTGRLLSALKDQKIHLRDLKWQQLEDVVYELLRSRGLMVQMTPRSKDGGRDIIARGELIPGEPAAFAVEVKHKGVVGVSDLRSTLYANGHFPLVMLATSGSFSAGVVQEKQKPENFFRLLLKDGQALESWMFERNPNP